MSSSPPPFLPPPKKNKKIKIKPNYAENMKNKIGKGVTAEQKLFKKLKLRLLVDQNFIFKALQATILTGFTECKIEKN